MKMCNSKKKEDLCPLHAMPRGGSIIFKLVRLQLAVPARWRLARTSCPRPQFRFLASPGAVTGATQVVHSGQPPFPRLFSSFCWCRIS